MNNLERTVDISNYIFDCDIDNIKDRLSKHSIPEPNSGCHIWIGSTTVGGYGVINILKVGVGAKHLSAHRVSYFINKGPIPNGFTIDHLCNNTYCINPFHLEAKTLKDNLLRSNSPSMINLRKTHCNKGHEFTEGNTIINKNGSRDCRVCVKSKKKRHYNNRREHILSVKKKYWEKNKKAKSG